MPNKNYARGYRAEMKAIEQLRNMGYWAQRFHASKGSFDIIAINEVNTRLIEVKRSAHNIVSQDAFSNLYSDDIAEIQQVPDSKNLSKELWVYIDGKGSRKAAWRKFIVPMKGKIQERYL